jgi:hypothetical protein
VARLPREKEVQRGADEVHVRARVDASEVSHCHLRRHVRRRPDDLAARRARRRAHRPAQRDPPVDEVHLAEAADHHVVELHVPVHDAARVRKVQRVAHAHQHVDLRAQAVSLRSQC